MNLIICVFDPITGYDRERVASSLAWTAHMKDGEGLTAFITVYAKTEASYMQHVIMELESAIEAGASFAMIFYDFGLEPGLHAKAPSRNRPLIHNHTMSSNVNHANPLRLSPKGIFQARMSWMAERVHQCRNR